jgi:hypothetical protein
LTLPENAVDCSAGSRSSIDPSIDPLTSGGGVTKIISVRSASRAGSKAWLGTFLFFVFLFPSLYQFEKYIGMVGVSAFIVIGLIVSILFFGPASMKIFQNLSDRQAKALCAVLFTIVIIIFLFGYPLANSGRIGGGSDLDEELDSSVRNILAGRSPYEGATYLGNSIDLLPGEFFLSLPFVVLGYSAYQNFFWLACFLWTAAVFLKDYRSMLLLFAALLIFCPAVWQELIVGSDRFTNGIHILVAVSLLMTVTSQETGWRKLIIASQLFSPGTDDLRSPHDPRRMEKSSGLVRGGDPIFLARDHSFLSCWPGPIPSVDAGTRGSVGR